MFGVLQSLILLLWESYPEPIKVQIELFPKKIFFNRKILLNVKESLNVWKVL